MFVEVLLQLLIGIVDVELLESVHLEGTGRGHGYIIPNTAHSSSVSDHDFQNGRLTSKFSKPKMSRIPMDLKLSFPLIFWLILMMIQEKHWEYSAMATESRESTAWKPERECGAITKPLSASR